MAFLGGLVIGLIIGVVGTVIFMIYIIAHWDELAKTAGKWQYEKMQQYEIKNRSSKT